MERVGALSVTCVDACSTVDIRKPATLSAQSSLHGPEKAGEHGRESAASLPTSGTSERPTPR